MFDRLVEFLVSILYLFKFWLVVPECTEAVILRLGKRHRRASAGFHWMWPLGIETYWDDNVVPATLRTEPQSLTTKDGRTCVISAVLTWRVTDIEKLLFSVESRESVLIDAAYGEIGEYVRKREWDALRSAQIENTLKNRINTRAAEFGLEVDRVQLKDLAICRPLRLIGLPEVRE